MTRLRIDPMTLDVVIDAPDHQDKLKPFLYELYNRLEPVIADSRLVLRVAPGPLRPLPAEIIDLVTAYFARYVVCLPLHIAPHEAGLHWALEYLASPAVFVFTGIQEPPPPVEILKALKTLESGKGTDGIVFKWTVLSYFGTMDPQRFRVLWKRAPLVRSITKSQKGSIPRLLYEFPG